MASGSTTVYLGMDAAVYVGSTLIDQVKDVTLNLSSATADVTTRANDGWRATVRTLKEASVSFQMVATSDSSSQLALFTNSFFGTGSGSDQLLTMSILDGPSGTGLNGEFSVTSCNRSEALEDAITYDIELSLVKFTSWGTKSTT